MTDLIFEGLKETMEGDIQSLEKSFNKVRTGRASVALLDGIKVDYYGVMTPINQTANITSPDPRQIIVQPWDKSVLIAVEKAIMAANIGLNPKNEGEILRIIVPSITEERRRELVKQAKSEAENTKIGIRNSRRSANDEAKQLEKDGIPEDDVKKLQDDIQKLTDEFVEKIDKLIEAKEKDIMTI